MQMVEYARMLARYNAWQNRSLLEAADKLDDADRRRNRGAFFGSIHGTLAHVLWADHTWMSRLSDWPKPDTTITDSPGFVSDWAALKSARNTADAAITNWTEMLCADDLEGDLAWHSDAVGRDVAKPRALCLVHLFNHQTHHRGQTHAMLTAAGEKPGATDLFLLPEDG